MANRIEIFEQILANEPDNTMVLFGLANEYLKIENYKEGIATLETYLNYDADEGAAYGMLAKAYETTGMPEKAKAAYKKGIEVSISNGHPTMAEEYRIALESEE